MRQGRLKYIELSIIVIIVLCLGATTYRRNLVWSTGVSLWSDVVKKSPGKARPHNNLGLAYCWDRTYFRAAFHLRQALRFKPEWINPRYNLGIAYQGARLYDRAIAQYEKILQKPLHPHSGHGSRTVRPYLAKVYNNLGVCYFAAGRHEKAAAEFRNSLRINPDYADARYNLEMVLQRIQNKKPGRSAASLTSPVNN